MRMARTTDETIILDFPYGVEGLKAIDDIWEAGGQRSQLEERTSELVEETIRKGFPREGDWERKNAELIFDYPVVYVAHTGGGQHGWYDAYVGETNDIIQRTGEHVREMHGDGKWKEFADKRGEEALRQYVIGNARFNKSLTLDVENRMIEYLSSCERVRELYNGRPNPQRDYYTHDDLDDIFAQIWSQLHDDNPELFPAEGLIRDSALFKASPFHRLSDEQYEAERAVLDIVRNATRQQDGVPTLILVSGMAGTGKTVLLSKLFYDLVEEQRAGEFGEDGKAPIPIALIVNHDEQHTVYEQIAKKLRLKPDKDTDVVFKGSKYITKAREQFDRTGRKVRVALIDEAHLLATQGNQGYQGKNMLEDILKYTDVVIAVFDPYQILRSSQRWPQRQMEILAPKSNGEKPDPETPELVTFNEETGQLVEVRRIALTHQFRMDADNLTLAWFDAFIKEGEVLPLPICGRHERNDKERRRERKKESRKYGTGMVEQDDLMDMPYVLEVCSSPLDVMERIWEHARREQASGYGGKGLSRVVASYDWEFSSARPNPSGFDNLWNVELYRWQDGTWRCEPPEGFDESLRGHAVASADAEAKAKQGYFSFPWNREIKRWQKKERKSRRVDDNEKAWAERDETLFEIGSTYTIQGFDLNYAGVILGPSIGYDRETERIVFHPERSKNYQATQKRGGKIDYSIENLRNELNVLMTRGVHGTYLFAADPDLQQALLEAQRNRGATW